MRKNDFTYQPAAPDTGIVMEAVPAYQIHQIGPYTVEDYYKIPDEHRVELIDGYFYDMASPSWTHQGILTHLLVQIYHCIEKSGRSCMVFQAPLDVQLDCDNRTMVQPDLLVICNRDEHLEGHRTVWGAPDFVVEVLSKSSRLHDRVRKYRKYQQAGVREYWIIDPEKKEVLVTWFEGGEKTAVYPFDAEVELRISEGRCKIDFRDIAGRVF
ncbi:MAG: Uma2 family endonuclease [Eubacterium sp.]|nr:Uma2 family endonuclease [Eubacterium sp.]